jgi:hypothetical protein
MPADHSYAFPEPHPGMDHEHYDWSPLNARRAPLRWAGNARVALCVIVTLEHLEWSRMIGETFGTLYREGAQSGRLLVLHRRDRPVSPARP